MIDNVKAPVHHYRPAKVECIVANADYFVSRTLLHEHYVHPIDNAVGVLSVKKSWLALRRIVRLIMFDGDVGETILVGFVHSIMAVVGVSMRSSSEIILIGITTSAINRSS